MKLSEYLEAHKFRLVDFSEKSGVKISAISEIKNGRKRASMNEALRIHRATGGAVTFADMVGDQLAAASGSARPVEAVETDAVK